MTTEEPTRGSDDNTSNEYCPALLVEAATVETAAPLADELHELLSDERVPEAMRVDTRARIADLHRRFPQAFDNESLVEDDNEPQKMSETSFED